MIDQVEADGRDARERLLRALAVTTGRRRLPDTGAAAGSIPHGFLAQRDRRAARREAPAGYGPLPLPPGATKPAS
jgi:hypothetical protein